ncbi:MFS transporter, NNP family, nitrate/nitrite transporter [Geodermatophilus obscurus]|uniref:MFS transporter, NNP family, nitrate/nitrite transporter n=1 Tax=Geodermatophilus obscurus TaxID=1861 RepID=A0A1M7UN48_9ACTN|nr:nitrate/nitrite transporter [Geodermatophilus obscurus]SHN84432.1 MFS transporter, NNP family, nitrate/nitrite transporter [Geodermatophilus obscurus]
MAATSPPTRQPTAPLAVPTRPGRWIDDWRPEDPAFWASTGEPVARRNLFFSVFSEHIGFSIWSLWSVLVLFLPEAVYGIDPAGKFLLTTLPTALGAFVRLPYTFAVAKFGGRNWTIVSAALLLVPTIATAVVLEPGVDYATLLVVSCLAGVGGGNFASSMANINAFYPNRLKGWALGLNAGGGNLGVPVVQLVGLLVLATAGVQHPRLVLVVYIPLIVVAAVGAALLMDNLTTARNQPRAMREATREPHTWIMSFLYIGTFGSFIGFGFAFGQVLQNQFTGDFATPLAAASLTWLGPLLGSLIRPLGGSLADRFGGARITFWNFAAMAVGAAIVWTASQVGSLPLFVVGFVSLFVLSGLGNGSTYTMIPAIFRTQAQQRVAAGADTADADRHALRMSGALIGIAGAVGAFGGVLVNLAFRQSFLTTGTGDSAYLVFIAFYLVCLAVTWAVYLRPRTRMSGV